MRLDCHAHTRRYSACSSLAPDELCRLALERGLDAVVFTEHHHQWTRADLARLEQAHPPLRLYAGMELSLAEQYDVVLIAPPPLLTSASLARPRLHLAEIARRLAPVRQQIFSFVAHPFRYSCAIPQTLQDILHWVDGMEVNSVNLLKYSHVQHQGLVAPANWECYAQALARTPCIALYNTDCHHPSGVGALANQLPGPPPEDEAGLVQLLRSAPIVQWQHASGLQALLARFQ